MQRKGSSLATVTIGGLTLLAVASLYALSAAPALRLLASESTIAAEGAPRAWDVFYRPLTWAMRSTPFRSPLFRWSDLWVSRGAMSAAVDGPFRTTLSLIFGPGQRVLDEDEEAALAETFDGEFADVSDEDSSTAGEESDAERDSPGDRAK